MTSPPGFKVGDDAASQRRRGGWMMIVAGWAAMLVIATMLFGGALDRQQNPNNAAVLAGQGGDDEVLLLANAQGHYFAEGTMNGANVLFLLDTGATEIAVPSAVADRIGLTPGNKALVNTANGIAEVHQTTIGNITIGNIAINDLRGAILPQMEGDAVLLGMNALGRLNLSQRGGELRLSVPER